MKYNCELCDYHTDNRTSYYQHKQGQKHQEKVGKQDDISNNFQCMSKSGNNFSINLNSLSDTENSPINTEIFNDTNVYKCRYCGIIFKTNSGLYKHNKKCTTKNEIEIKKSVENKINEVKIDFILKEKELIQQQLEEIKKEKEKQLEKTEKLLEKSEKEKEELKKEKEEEKKKLEEQLLYYRDVAYNKVENDCNMTNLNFINTHYKDAPALEGPKDLHKLFNADKSANPDVYYAKLASELGSHHRLNILHVVISDFIVKEYCKENKSEQSVWNSDSSRLNYIIKEFIQKDKIWIMDKSGKTLLNKVIRPIIEYIRVDLEEAKEHVISFSKKPNGITFLDMNDHRALLEIGNNIMNKSLEEDILKELTKHFNINQKLLLKDIQAKNKELGNKGNKGIKMIKDKIIDDEPENKIKDKLSNAIKDLDNKLNKLRKEERNLDLNNTDDNKKEKYKKIEDSKKELKTKKKEINKLLTSYNDIEQKLEEVTKEEDDISNDTESEHELETQRQIKISRTMRKKKDILNKKKEIEKEINNYKLSIS